MDELIHKKARDIAEKFFGTEEDPDQIPITKESAEKLYSLHPDTILHEIKEGEPVSWVVLLPTTNELADRFLNGSITERELMNMTMPQEKYEAIYLCSAFTMPEYRRQGKVIDLAKRAITSIPHIPNVRLFAWPYSEEGKETIIKLEKILGKKIEIKK